MFGSLMLALQRQQMPLAVGLVTDSHKPSSKIGVVLLLGSPIFQSLVHSDSDYLDMNFVAGRVVASVIFFILVGLIESLSSVKPTSAREKLYGYLEKLLEV